MQTISARIARFPAKRFVANGVSLSYREVGGRRDVPIVLLHGIGSGSASWLQQFENSPPGYRLIAWDAPGYGDSDLLGTHSPAASDYAARLGEFIEALELGPVHLLGHSLGALIATAFAARYPARIRSLILADPASGYGGRDEQTRSAILSGRIENIRASGADGVAARLHERLLSAEASEDATGIVQWGARRLRTHGYEDAVKMLASGDLIGDAPGYNGSVLVLCGSSDVVTPPSDAKKVAAAFSQGIYSEIEGAGHASYIEAPGLFDQKVFDFTRQSVEIVSEQSELQQPIPRNQP